MKKTWAIVFFAAIIFQGCIHTYYVPNVQNVPLFTEKGEFQMSGYLGAGEYSKSVEIQTAVAISNNIGLASNFMHNRDDNLDKDDFSKGNYIEAAAGYFHPVQESGTFEIYGGVGTGGQHHSYKTTEIEYKELNTRYNKADLSYTKLYLQPAYGYRFNIYELAFSTRFSSLAYNDLTSNFTREQSNYNNLSSLTEKTHFLLEPAITFRVDFENIKAQVQYIYSAYLNNNHLDLFEKQHISIGIVFYKKNRRKQELTYKQAAKYYLR